jgi:tetratricopeptide (TPR) repeat protein
MPIAAGEQNMKASSRRTRRTRGCAGWAAGLVGLALGATLALPAQARAATPAPVPAPPTVSAMDGQLFLQLLIAELEWRRGEAGIAYQLILDAARRTRDEALFRRSVEIALQARAGEQALIAARAWREATPLSVEAARYEIRLLLALNRVGEVAAPLHTLLEQTAPADRAGLIAALPQLFQRSPEPRTAAATMESLLRPYLGVAATAAAARVTLARLWRAAGDQARALALLQEAAALDPASPAPPLLAVEMMAGTAAAEALVRAALRAPQADLTLRLAYARALAAAQRYTEAIEQLRLATEAQPSAAAAWLLLGALRVELRESKAAEQALLRYVELSQAATAAAAQGPATDADDAREDLPAGAPPEEPERQDDRLTQAWLLLAQAAEQRGDLQAAEAWLARIEQPERLLAAQIRHASLLARRGQVEQARALVRAVPARSEREERAKVFAESQLLRELRLWDEAYAVLAAAGARFPDDTDVLYERAMMAERLSRLADMERLLRRVIELEPGHYHAHNALGYVLADRNLRLPEARALILRALELAPGDPFITDSLGWVEFRLGNLPEALRLLRQAHAARPDAEIAAHLGEVLWVMGEREEALRVWRDAKRRDAGNEVLRETLVRLRVDL